MEKDLTLNRQVANLPAKPPKAKYSARAEKKPGTTLLHRFNSLPRACADARVTIPRLMHFQALFHPALGKITSTLNDGRELRFRVRPVA